MTHEQLLAISAAGWAIVWFRPEDGSYESADVLGVTWRPVPAVAYPHDWPEWRPAGVPA